MSEMANESTGRAQQAGQTARQDVSAAVDEARAQAGAMAGDLRMRVTEEAESQTRRDARVMRQWADDLSVSRTALPRTHPPRAW
ncbi:hypothetical protein ACFXJM_35790 [Streptomyces massasporeus]